MLNTFIEHEQKQRYRHDNFSFSFRTKEQHKYNIVCWPESSIIFTHSFQYLFAHKPNLMNMKPAEEGISTRRSFDSTTNKRNNFSHRRKL